MNAPSPSLLRTESLAYSGSEGRGFITVAVEDDRLEDLPADAILPWQPAPAPCIDVARRGHGARQSDHSKRVPRGEGHRPVYRQPYAYSQPVYVPPPVYYEPQQSPGISLFFPLDLRR